ncbi:MAG: hypothetical protein JSS74_15835 [Actinobacteria bacterium]|nr:hypothetical protein [Actinomycetota bacterium]
MALDVQPPAHGGRTLKPSPGLRRIVALGSLPPVIVFASVSVFPHAGALVPLSVTLTLVVIGVIRRRARDDLHEACPH